MDERDDPEDGESSAAGEENAESEGGSRPGPVYNAALKEMFEADLAGACRVLGVRAEGRPEALSGEFALTTRAVDLLVRVGPGRLMHVEYARRATSDLVARMLVYRGLIMQQYPKHHISQHILVLGGGTVDGYDDYSGTGFAVDLRPLYLRDAEPSQFTNLANFAPLAILRRGGPDELARVAAKVVTAVRAQGGERTDVLLESMTVLAVIASDSAVVERIIEETGMTVETVAAFYRESRHGRRLLAEGREEGREAERESLLTALLVERFGPDPELPVLVRRLAGWPVPETAVHAISIAASLDELLTADCPE